MNTLDTLLEDPHLADVGFIEEVEHPTEGRIRTLRPPIRWSRSRPGPWRPAPNLGEHTAQVLAESGYTEQEIATLRRTGVMGDSSETAVGDDSSS
jgi:crotonobetainyl-CoA:carnitine CoA-transferase CaiB-like acyl-CoA transferase